MTKILTQQDWDNLPVHTTATLTRLIMGVPHTVHVTRAASAIQLKDDGYLLLGGLRWSKIFADSDTAHTLFVPAGRPIDVSELTALLDRQDQEAPLEIACGHRRFRPDRWAENSGRTVGDDKAVMECSALDDKAVPSNVGELLRFLSMGLDMAKSWGLRITQGTLLSVAADGLEWGVTGIEEQDGTVIVTTDLLIDEPADPAPQWTSVDEFVRRANETAKMRGDLRYSLNTPKGRILRDIQETEESLKGLEAAVAATEEQLKCWVADAERRRKDLAVARYIVGVTEHLESPEEVSVDV